MESVALLVIEKVPVNKWNFLWKKCHRICGLLIQNNAIESVFIEEVPLNQCFFVVRKSASKSATLFYRKNETESAVF